MKRLNLLRTQLSSVLLLNQTNTSNDFFKHVPEAPIDAILGTTIKYRADKDPRKVDLGVGAFRTEEAQPYIFEVVKIAEKEIYEELANGKSNKEYQPSEGNADFLELSKKVVFGPNFGSNTKRIASSQACGGTGALRIAADFLKVFNPTTIYLPVPTWGNHQSIFKSSGLQVADYPYYKDSTRGLDLEGLLKRFEEIPDKSVILLHACAHNPTGVDPSPEEWQKIAAVMKKKNHFPFFDNAYQGFASGDLHKDAYSIRYFVEQGFQMIVTQSYSKTIGLYGERAGAFHLLCENEKTAHNALTQIRIVVRTNYSNPPLHPMKLVLKVLSNEKLYNHWLSELQIVAGRIIKMRKLLRDELERIQTPGDWSNITNQIGMFTYTGMTVNQSKRMIDQHHVYMLTNGRISMPGLNTKNVGYVAECMKKSILEGQQVTNINFSLIY